MKLTLIVLGLVAAVGCGKLGLSPAPESTPDNPEISETPATGLLRMALLPQALPNQYSVSIDWTSSTDADLVRRDRRGEKTLCHVPECPKPFFDRELVAGETVEYELVSNGSVIAGGTISVPEDLVVKGTQLKKDIRDFEKYHRLFLRNGARLVTHGSLSLDLDSLISDGGVIETFAETDVAAYGPGRAAGDIRITAQSASGNLKIISRGERGAKGVTGVQGLPGFDASKSESRPQAAVVIDCMKFDSPNILWCLPTLHSLKDVPRTDSRWKEVLQCSAPPRDGFQGGTGGTGYPGEMGQRGGDAGAVFVTVVNPLSFDVEVDQIGGAGGESGDGGPGGIGGPGGAPGKQDPTQVCPPGKPGLKGEDGKVGPKGNPGAPGRAEFPKEIRL